MAGLCAPFIGKTVWLPSPAYRGNEASEHLMVSTAGRIPGAVPTHATNEPIQLAKTRNPLAS